MPRKGHRDPKSNFIAGDLTHPEGLGSLLRAYLDKLGELNYSPDTIKKRRLQLNDFIRWCEDRSLTQAAPITRPILERYQRHLHAAIDKRGKPYSFGNQHTRLCSLRAWFKWLARRRHIVHNPASELELPKLGHRLPRHVLTGQETEDILNRIDVTRPLGIRDRAMLETFYSSGIRRLELIHLNLCDVDQERGVLSVRQGKGKKDRVVPIGDRALAWLDKYAHDVRPALLTDEQEQSVFLTRMGQPFSASSLSLLVSRHVQEAAPHKPGSCHLFRHTMATLMHENGADIRHLQAMLGHAKLDTTQIYTQVSIRKLKEVHDATHPARHERTEKRPPDNVDKSPDNGCHESTNDGQEERDFG